MKVSVIVVTHSAYRQYLGRALDTISNQTPHELIIVNNERNLATGCNEGISRSTGDYIVRVDADDWVDPQLFEIEQTYLDEHPDIDAVWCDYWETREIGDNIYSLDYLQNVDLEHACAVMYRRQVWEELKYDESLEFQESYDFWQRFKLAGFKGEHIPMGLYFYRKGHQSMSTSPERDKVRAELKRKYNAYNDIGW